MVEPAASASNAPEAIEFGAIIRRGLWLEWIPVPRNCQSRVLLVTIAFTSSINFSRASRTNALGSSRLMGWRLNQLEKETRADQPDTNNDTSDESRGGTVAERLPQLAASHPALSRRSLSRTVRPARWPSQVPGVKWAATRMGTDPCSLLSLRTTTRANSRMATWVNTNTR